MSKIDTSEWKSFIIGDLFNKLNLGIKNPNFNKALDVSEKKTDEFNIPVVNAKHGNNGIMFYGRKGDFETAAMTIDIVQNGAVATGDVYAQPQETGVLWDAYLIKLKQEIDSKYVLIFLSLVLEKSIKGRFSYDDKCVWDKLSQLSVKLPVDSQGIPDWGYMHSYMMRIMNDSCEMVEKLISEDFPKKKIDVVNWVDFSLRDLGFSIFHGQRLNRAHRVDGDIPFITAGSENRGLKQYIATDRTVYSNPITVDMFGNCFYQPYVCCGDDNVYFFVNDQISYLSKMFIATSVNSQTVYKYSYREQFRQTDADSLTVKLPVTASGNPDWDYMEIYMSQMMDKAYVMTDSLKNS